MSLNRKTKRALLSNKNKFDFESIDGGHRKRAVKEYLNNEFSINYGELETGKEYSVVIDDINMDDINMNL